MKEGLLQFFKEGFFLANRCLDLFLITLVLSLPSLLNLFIKDPAFSRVTSILSLPLVFLEVGFSLSLPALLFLKLQKKRISYKEIFITTIKSTKQIVLPLLLIMLMVIVGLVVLLFMIAIIFRPNSAQVQIFFQNFGNWRFFFAVISSFFVLFEFTAFYFSLENQGLFKSIRKGLLTALGNLKYISYLALAHLIIYTLTAFVPIDFKLGMFAVTIVNFYAAFIFTSITLIYYLRVIKKG